MVKAEPDPTACEARRWIEEDGALQLQELDLADRQRDEEMWLEPLHNIHLGTEILRCL